MGEGPAGRARLLNRITPTTLITRAAFDLARQAAVHEKLAEGDPSDARWQTDLAKAAGAEGRLLLDRGTLDGARASLETARGLLERQLRKSPNDRHARELLAGVYLDLGTFEERVGHPPRALEVRRLAVATLAPLACGSKDPAILDPWVRSLLAVGRVAEARAQAVTLLGLGYREPTFLALCHRWNLGPKEGETPGPS